MDLVRIRRLTPLAAILVLVVVAWLAPHTPQDAPLPPPQRAWVTVGVQLAIAIAALILARLLLKPKNRPKNLNEDDSPTTLSTRGMRLPYPVGRWLIGYGFGWAGDEYAEAIEEAVEGGGGGKGSLFGGPPSQTQTIWYMPAWHELCPGIVTKLISIEDNGQTVWKPDTPLTPANTPSGSVVDAGILGTFEIYWGELDQPMSEFLAARIGVASRWPGLCYIVWTRARLGPSRIWPQRKYEVEKMYPCVEGLSCNYLLDDGESRGVNPAWFFYGLFAGESPDGCDLDFDQVDQNFLNELCQLCVAEHLPMNMLISDGDTAESVVKGLLSDLGILIYDDRGVLTGSILRPPTEALPVLDDTVLTSPDLESVVDQSPEQMQLATFLFKDASLRWKDNDVTYQDDFGEGQDTSNPGQFQLTMPTDYATAEKIAARRIQEVMGDRSTKQFQVMRNAGRFVPGHPFINDGQPYRVAAVQRSTTSAVTTIEAFLDSYAINPTLNGPDVIPTGSNPAAVAEDLAVNWFEIPAEVSGSDVAAISVLRIRAHSGISGASVWISADSGSYARIGQQNAACAGGELLEDWGLSGLVGGDVVEVGQTFEAWNSDIANARNLTSDVTAWQAGSQLLVINEEAFFLRNLTSIPSPDWTAGTLTSSGTRRHPTTPTGFSYVATTTGTTDSTEPVWPTTRLATVVDGGVTWQARGLVFRLDGAIRARLGTVKQAHTTGDVVFIAPYSSAIRSLTSSLLVPGANICVKVQPFAGSQTLDLTAADPFCDLFTGIAFSTDFWVTEDGDTLITHTGDRLIF